MKLPIFMFGALRSGTTLFGLMLNANERINCPVEADFIFDYLKKCKTSQRWIYDLDGLRRNRIFHSQSLTILESEDGKAIAQDFIAQLQKRDPGYLCLPIHRHANKAGEIFPNSKIIHIIRDPRDVAKSSINMGWAGNTHFGIEHWLETEDNWERSRTLFDKAKILELRFEDLVSAPRAMLEQVCKFIGVPYQPEMLNYSEHSTYAPPDPSVVAQWRAELSPREIALVELKAKPFIESRGYDFSGHPLHTPGFGEVLYLFYTNKLYKWRFAYRRYGIFNVVMEKLTRRLHKSANFIFVHRMNEIDKRYLK
jgi:hypothetical protein